MLMSGCQADTVGQTNLSCWLGEAMVLPGPCMSGAMILLQLGSVLMSKALVSTKSPCSYMWLGLLRPYWCPNTMVSWPHPLPVAGELALPLTSCQTMGRGNPRGHGLKNSATTQAEIQSYKLAHLISYPIYEPLEHMKGPLLWNRSQRKSTALSDNSIFEKNLGEGLVLMVSQKVEAPNQTNDSL